MTASNPKTDPSAIATRVFRLGIASLILLPVAFVLAPVALYYAWHLRGAQLPERERRRASVGSALAVATLTLFVVVAVVGSVTEDDAPKRRVAADTAHTTAAATPRSGTTSPTQPTTALTVRAPATTTTSVPTPTTSTAGTTTAPPTTTSTITTTATTTRPATRPTTRKKKPARRQPSRGISVAFFEAMDNDAIALDDAIGRSLDGESGAGPAIERIRKRIRDRLNRHLLAGRDVSIGANLLLSAGAKARGAESSGNLPRLVDARRDIDEARRKLADEVAAK